MLGLIFVTAASVVVVEAKATNPFPTSSSLQLLYYIITCTRSAETTVTVLYNIKKNRVKRNSIHVRMNSICYTFTLAFYMNVQTREVVTFKIHIRPNCISKL